jgi:heavy metal translocating P-type ATPase
MTEHNSVNFPHAGPSSVPGPAVAEPSGCHLCGLALRRGAVADTSTGNPLHFCCQGCRAVYHMLLASAQVQDPALFKQTALYRQCVAAGVIPADEADLRRIHAWEARETLGGPSVAPDSAAALPASGAVQGTGTLDLHLMVDGMWCTACAWVIENTLGRMDGVEAVACQFFTDRLSCRYRPDRVAPHEIRAAVARLGYDLRETDAGTADRQLQRRQLTRLAITGVLSGNVMMLSWALYAGFFTELSAASISALSLPIVVMAAVVLVYGGEPILRKAWFGLIRGAPGMEALVGLGAVSTFLYSFYNWYLGSIHLYFDTACMLVTLVLLGKLLEQQARSRVRRDLDAFFALQPAKVRLLDERWPLGRYVAIEQVAIGDRFGVQAGEIVPADGRVVAGAARMDESSLTGEPLPVAVKPGDAIKSGTRLLDGAVTATVEKVGEATILGQMIAVMARGLAQEGSRSGRIDRALLWFVPVTLLLAAVTGLGAAWAGLTMDQAVLRAVTVVVISCPCALGVAIPMARLAGISLAGREGILVRDLSAFERAGAIDAVVFDKTGTLTHGRWELLRIECLPGFAPALVTAWAAGLEQDADHEVARSILAHAAARGIMPAQAETVTITAGGVFGRIAHQEVRIGKPDFAWPPHATPPEAAAAPSAEGTISRVYVGVGGRPAAVLHFGDTIRDRVPAMIQWLKQTQLEIHLISGDDDAVAREVARVLGVAHARGGLLPTEKVAYIEKLQRQGLRVAMVGDGINDAAAMAVAHLAVAVYNGTGLVKEAAHLSLMRGDPTQLTALFPLARRVNRKVVQNLGCAWIYNLISIPVAMSGLLTPLVAATAMLLSSLTVIGNTLLLILGTKPPPRAS